ncbi:aminoglycoside adenylyltransferase family protein [soil metagenome]
MEPDSSLPEHLALEETDREQIAHVLAPLRDVLGDELIGAYLHGSSVLGGLRAQSDIDVLAVSARRITRDEKRRIVAHLLAVSGTDSAAAPPRPVELTIVVWSEIRPWRYPPTMDFQYGEWWRKEFERGELEPWPSRTNPDLTPLVAMVLLGGATLTGPPPYEVFDPVPDADFIDALVAGIAALMDDIDSDTRNVVLTLARIWSGVVTGAVQSKDAAAEWALPRLAPEHRVVLARARGIYLGTEEEHWGDLQGRICPFAEAVVAEVEAVAPTE